MITFILCYVFNVCLSILQSLFVLFYLKTSNQRIRISFAGDSTYKGKIGSIDPQFSWRFLLYFSMGVGKSHIPEIGKEYHLQKEAVPYSVYFVSLITLLSFLIISVISLFPLGMDMSYLSPIFSYIFFIHDASILPELNLAQTICFYLFCMCIYKLISLVLEYLQSRTKIGAYSLLIVLPMLFIWLSAVVRLFLLNHSFVELLLFILIYIFINGMVGILMFLIFKILGMRKENSEEIKTGKAFFYIKNSLLLATHQIDTFLTRSTETRLLFSEKNLGELFTKQSIYKSEYEFKENLDIASMLVAHYCIESFENSQVAVLIRHDLNSTSWDKRLTFLIEFEANNSVNIVPGGYENGAIIPWINSSNI